MIKGYSEMRKINVEPFCEFREAKDDKGKTIKVPYLNWAKCKELLHENGAEVVYYEPLLNDKGSSLFMTDLAFTDSKGQTNRCFEVRVKVVIDDKEFLINYPLMNGAYVVREDTINQLRLSNAQARAFVKGVAIHTGLGFGLWVKDDETTTKGPEEENLYSHNILKVKLRVEQLLTQKMDSGLTIPDICKELKVDEDQFNVYMKQFAILDRLEKAIQKL